MATPKTGTKSKVSSPRVTVLIGQIKKKIGGKDVNTNVYSRVKKDVAEKLGLKAVTPTGTPSSKSGSKTKRSPVPPRGSVSGGSITVVLTDGKRYSLPIPSGVTIVQTIAFIQKNVKSAQSFVTKNGVTRSVAKASGK